MLCYVEFHYCYLILHCGYATWCHEYATLYCGNTTSHSDYVALQHGYVTLNYSDSTNHCCYVTLQHGYATLFKAICQILHRIPASDFIIYNCISDFVTEHCDEQLRISDPRDLLLIKHSHILRNKWQFLSVKNRDYILTLLCFPVEPAE